MALNFSTIPLYTNPNSFLVPKHKHPFKFYHFYCSSSPSFSRAAALSEGTESRGVVEEDTPTFSGSSSTRTQLDLLEQLTSGGSSVNGIPLAGYESDGSSPRLTIRDQLAKLVGERDDNFIIPLGKNLKKFSPKILTISQKRNIKRQAYLDEVSQRNDSVFFVTIGAFVILPPLIILGVAIATGYVQLFP